jgi:hypothetical protein
MNIAVPPEIELALQASAQVRGLTPEATVIELLRERLFPTRAPLVPQDDWERRILAMGRDCGVSLPAEALTSDGIYD